MAWDIAELSAGRIGPDPMDMYASVDVIRDLVAAADPDVATPVTIEDLDAPVPRPAAVVAIGLNYAEHAHESGFEAPAELPPVFTKWPSSITSAHDQIVLPAGSVDWEVEVVAVLGRALHRAAEEDVVDALAGVTVGQDLSERDRQLSGPAPQFGLAKSFPGFSPIGPWVVTLDDAPGLDDLHLGCAVDGEVVQDGTTAHLLYPVVRAVAELSQILTFQPGDLVFTGTPDGVGMARRPPRYLQSGQTLSSWVDGVGRMEHQLVTE
ncbi:fumarylacetoacetate hydrolase family protein [Janibacter cremeus]|uniref:fumarylacetoacetate hydrolase family protein n=1 Tax=Janibacter cremeus TaxID=1285192 RepID=UPI0023F80894|nr:fumarylacetoacetate hydrolase family protein [Janibacter cremeus]WEV77393.1 fumarylacetoacetate hydrolase family protein [Janibacter cremeus]